MSWSIFSTNTVDSNQISQTYPYVRLTPLTNMDYINSSIFAKYLSYVVKKLRSNNKIPEYFVNIQQREKSKADSFFEKILRNEFGLKIETRGCIMDPAFKVPPSNLVHCDFLYIDVQNSIYIDIEIDEPYCLKSRQIKNCYNFDVENYRDDIFVKNGFSVIRFSEEQILYETIGCVEFIKEVIDILRGKKVRVSNTIPLKAQTRWNSELAGNLERIKYRDRYVSQFSESTTVLEYI